MDVRISVGRRLGCAAMISLLLACCGCRSWSPWSTAKDAPREQPQDVYTAMASSLDAGTSAAGPPTQYPPGQVASSYPLPTGSSAAPMFAGPTNGAVGGGFGPVGEPTPTISNVSFTGYVGDPLPGVSLSTVAGFGSQRPSESRANSAAGKSCSSGC